MQNTAALAKIPVPTGNPWVPSRHDPATIPVPLPVIIRGYLDLSFPGL